MKKEKEREINMKKTYIEIIYKNKKTQIKEIDTRNHPMHPNILCFRYYDKNKLNEKNNITKWIYNAVKVNIEDITDKLTNTPKYTNLLNYIQTNKIKEVYEIDKTYHKIPKNSTTYTEYSHRIETKKLKKINNIITTLEKNKNKKITVTYNYHGKTKTITGLLTEVIDYYGIKVDTYTLPYIDENITIIEIKNELNQKLYHNKYTSQPIDQQKEHIFGKIIIEEEQKEENKVKQEWTNYLNQISKNELTKLTYIKQGLILLPKTKTKLWIQTVNQIIDTNNGEIILNIIINTIELFNQNLTQDNILPLLETNNLPNNTINSILEILNNLLDTNIKPEQTKTNIIKKIFF